MQQTAILLLHCPDQLGIITDITKFITDNHGNIVYLDQYVDKVDGRFFMRVEWELAEFSIPSDKIEEYIETLYGTRLRSISRHYMVHDMRWSLTSTSTMSSLAWLCS